MVRRRIACLELLYFLVFLPPASFVFKELDKRERNVIKGRRRVLIVVVRGKICNVTTT